MNFAKGTAIIDSLGFPSSKARVGRLTKRSVRFTFSKKSIGNPASYGWQAYTRYTGSKGGSCYPPPEEEYLGACRDYAPNGSRLVEHKLR